MSERYDLEERLLQYSARIVRVADALPQTVAGKHMAQRILRCGTSPMAQHGEAEATESRKDLVHKMRMALKELREANRWLKLIQRIPLLEHTDLLAPLIHETDELIGIFVLNIKTAENNN